MKNNRTWLQKLPGNICSVLHLVTWKT